MNMVDVYSSVSACAADAMIATVNDRGRGFASDREAWAEAKILLERVKEKLKDAEDCHKEMWKSIKSGEDDACTALCQQLGKELATCAALAVQGSAVCQLAVLGEEADALREEE